MSSRSSLFDMGKPFGTLTPAELSDYVGELFIIAAKLESHGMSAAKERGHIRELLLRLSYKNNDAEARFWASPLPRKTVTA